MMGGVNRDLLSAALLDLELEQQDRLYELVLVDEAIAGIRALLGIDPPTPEPAAETAEGASVTVVVAEGCRAVTIPDTSVAGLADGTVVHADESGVLSIVEPGGITASDVDPIEPVVADVDPAPDSAPATIIGAGRTWTTDAEILRAVSELAAVPGATPGCGDIARHLGMTDHRPVLGRLRVLLKDGAVMKDGKAWYPNDPDAQAEDEAAAADVEPDEGTVLATGMTPGEIVAAVVAESELEVTISVDDDSAGEPWPTADADAPDPAELDPDKLTDLVVTYGDEDGIAYSGIVALLPYPVVQRLDSTAGGGARALAVALEKLAAAGKVRRMRGGRWGAPEEVGE